MGQSFKLRYGPFLGDHSSLNPRYITAPYGEFSHNMLHEDGSAGSRSGYRRFLAAPQYQGSSAVSCKMFAYVAGIVNNAFADEYLSVRRHGGNFCKLFRCDASNGANDKVIGKANAVDRIDLGSATGNTYKLTFGAQTTVMTIAPGATAATIQADLESLSNVEPGDVVVTLVDGVVHKYDVEWDGQYRGTTVPTLSITNDTLTGGTGVHTCTRTVNAQDYAMADSYWDLFQWDNDVYIYNYAAGDESSAPFSDAEPLLRYTQGDYSSLTAVKPPATPVYTSKPISVQFRRRAGSATAGYSQIPWKASGAVTYTRDGVLFDETAGELDATNPYLVLKQQNTNKGNAMIRVDITTLNIGAIDVSDNDAYGFSINIQSPGNYQFDPNSVKVTFETNAGTTLEASVRVKPSYIENASPPTLGHLDVYFTLGDRERADWTSLKHIKIEFLVTWAQATAADREIRISPITIGGIVNWGDPPSGQDEVFHGLFELGYSYGNSLDGFESGVAGSLVLHRDDLIGDVIVQGFDPPAYMGTIPYLTLYGSSDASVDKIYLYERRRVTASNGTVTMSKWRRIAEITDPAGATTNYVFGATIQDFESATEYSPGDFQIDNIVKAKAIHGSVLYMYRGQRENLRWSAVNDPLNLAAIDGSNVDINDPFHGVNMSMSDDQEDTPVDAWGVNNGTIVLGQKGVHTIGGTRPPSMGTCRRVNGVPGCLGRHASCPYSHNGLSGVAYVSRDGKSVWFVALTAVSDLENNVAAYELTNLERGEVDRHLLQRNPTIDGNVAALNYDPISDALWFNYSYRSMVLRRPGLLDNQRYWEHYTYGNQSNGSWSGTGWSLFVFDQDRGIKAIAPSGYIDEIEYDTSNSLARIGGEDAKPDATDTTNDTVQFNQDPKWPLGLALKPKTNGGGLLTSTTVYVRPTVVGTYQFHPTLADAQANTNRVNITASITSILSPIGRDNGNPLATGSIYWVGPVTNIGHEASALRADFFRKRIESRPSAKVWSNRNPESSPRQVASSMQSLRMWPDTQGSEWQPTLFIEDNSAPVYFYDLWLTSKGRRAGF